MYIDMIWRTKRHKHVYTQAHKQPLTETERKRANRCSNKNRHLRVTYLLIRIVWIQTCRKQNYEEEMKSCLAVATAAAAYFVIRLLLLSFSQINTKIINNNWDDWLSFEYINTCEWTRTNNARTQLVCFCPRIIVVVIGDNECITIKKETISLSLLLSWLIDFDRILDREAN